MIKWFGFFIPLGVMTLATLMMLVRSFRAGRWSDVILIVVIAALGFGYVWWARTRARRREEQRAERQAEEAYWNNPPGR